MANAIDYALREDKLNNLGKMETLFSSAQFPCKDTSIVRSMFKGYEKQCLDIVQELTPEFIYPTSPNCIVYPENKEANIKLYSESEDVIKLALLLDKEFVTISELAVNFYNDLLDLDRDFISIGRGSTILLPTEKGYTDINMLVSVIWDDEDGKSIDIQDHFIKKVSINKIV